MPGRNDAIHFVETLYGGTKEPESTWMKTVAAAAAPLFGPSTVVAASHIDLSGPAMRVVRLHGISRELSDEEMAASIDGQASSDWVGLTRTPVTVVSEHYGSATATRPGMTTLRAKDVLGISTRVGDEAFLVATTLAAPLRLDPRARRRWSRLAAHLSAAVRLRWASANRPSPREAILSPNGRVEHLESPSQPPDKIASLRRAVREIETARSGLRHSRPERALAMWRALVDGRWSLVDDFDSDGKRFIVARRNPPRAAKARALEHDERIVAILAIEGRSNKQIAYELGFAEATVSNLLRSAAAKVGARTRVELVGVLAALERTAEGRE